MIVTRSRGVLALVLLSLSSCGQAEQSPATQPRPALHLLTPLPLVWSETFGLDQPASPIIERIEQDFRVTPVDLPSQLPENGLLLAVQPRALPAEELVALDAWVRRGGKLLLLADPALEWLSELALGDPRRAPPMFPDTGLLRHWGLRLDAPDERGPAERRLDQRTILTASPGTLTRTGGSCEVVTSGFAARCSLGQGEVLVVADSDWLNVGTPDGLDGPTGENLDGLAAALESLDR